MAHIKHANWQMRLLLLILDSLTHLKEQQMATLSTNAAPATTSPISLMAFVAALFQLELREKLDAQTGGDKSDAAFTWGL
jgi:hypothetical protein